LNDRDPCLALRFFFATHIHKTYLAKRCGKNMDETSGAAIKANINASTIQDQRLPKFKV